MNWQEYWNHTSQSNEVLAQVGRLNVNQETAVQEAAERIVNLLNLQPEDRILDVCCGNGLLTSYIANKGYSITGVDLSEKLIENAKKSYPSVDFYRQDAICLDLNKTFDKLYRAFSFQYFDSFSKGKKVLDALIRHGNSNATIVLTDIPDKDRWGNYYNSLLKKFFYFKQMLTGKQTMGKFWSVKELLLICELLGVKGSVIQQPDNLPYSYYRFDFIINKTSKL